MVFVKGQKFTKEHKKKLSIISKKRWKDKEYSKNMSEVHKGQVSGMKGKNHTKETRNKMSVSKKGCEPWNKGIKGFKHSEETKKKISDGHKGKKHWWATSGKDNPNWKGGISKIDKLCRQMKEYKQWRSDIFQRDNWTCRTCNISDCYVTAHHIKGFSEILKENNIKDIKMARKCDELWDINNGVTLCEECHSLTDNYKGRGINK